MAIIPRPPVVRVTLILLLCLVSVSALVYLYEPLVAFSLFWGGLLFLVPQAYFAIYAFRFSGALYAQQVKLCFYRGQLGKYLLTLMGFAALFALAADIDLLVLFVSYIVMLLAHLGLSARLLTQ